VRLHPIGTAAHPAIATIKEMIDSRALKCARTSLDMWVMSTIFSPGKAAAYLGVSVKTVQRWIGKDASNPNVHLHGADTPAEEVVCEGGSKSIDDAKQAATRALAHVLQRSVRVATPLRVRNDARNWASNNGVAANAAPSTSVMRTPQSSSES
jgi:hypothetical protein